MEIWKYGNMEIWKCESVKVWKWNSDSLHLWNLYTSKSSTMMAMAGRWLSDDWAMTHRWTIDDWLQRSIEPKSLAVDTKNVFTATFSRSVLLFNPFNLVNLFNLFNRFHPDTSICIDSLSWTLTKIIRVWSYLTHFSTWLSPLLASTMEIELHVEFTGLGTVTSNAGRRPTK
jgi:hypothetical protein